MRVHEVYMRHISEILTSHKDFNTWGVTTWGCLLSEHVVHLPWGHLSIFAWKLEASGRRISETSKQGSWSQAYASSLFHVNKFGSDTSPQPWLRLPSLTVRQHFVSSPAILDCTKTGAMACRIWVAWTTRCANTGWWRGQSFDVNWSDDLWGSDIGDQFIVRSQADPNSDPSVRKLPAAERTARVGKTCSGWTSKAPYTGSTLRVWPCLWDAWSWQPQVRCSKPVCDAFVRDHFDQASKRAQVGFQLHSNCGSRRTEWPDLSYNKWARHLRSHDKEVSRLRCSWFDPVWSLPTLGWLHVSTTSPSTTSWFQCANNYSIVEDWPSSIVRMQEMTRDGIKPLPTGGRPLDAVVRNLESDHNVIYYMLPTPVAKEKPTKTPTNDAKKGDKEKDWNWNKWSPKQSWKKSQKTGRLPEALKGCSSSSSDGKRLWRGCTFCYWVLLWDSWSDCTTS